MSKKKDKGRKKHKKHSHQDDDSGTLFVSVKAARHLTGMDRKGTSDPYCVVKSTFNKQQFKTKVMKKNLNPEWNAEFKFFTSKLQGHIFIKIYDKDRWTSDDFLGEVAIPIKSLSNGEPTEEWYQLQNEPKKKKKDKNKQAGEVRIRLHYPIKNKPASKSNSKAREVADGKSSKETSTPKKKAEQKKVKEVYEFGKELGKGGFSVVKEATLKETGEKFAIKIIEKTAAEEELQLLQREIDIMKKLKHGNIIEMIAVYEEDDYIYLVMELVTGGELFDQIVSRGSYSEKDAATIVRQILEAIEYMHSNGIAHRDLKPENLLCSVVKKNEIIKVTDFGLSKDFGEDALKTSCGTPDYVAPEVLKGMAYDNSVDIWSIGVITYILLCGFPPFYGNNDQQIFEKIMKAEFDFPSPDWDNISDDAQDFIKGILVLDVNKRPTASQCLEHPWVKGNAPESPLAPQGQLKEYQKKRAPMKQ